MDRNSSTALSREPGKPIALRHLLMPYATLAAWVLVLLPAAVVYLRLMATGGSTPFADLLMICALCVVFVMMCIGGICGGTLGWLDRWVIVGAAVHLLSLCLAIGSYTFAANHNAMPLFPWVSLALMITQERLVSCAWRRVKKPA
jgi:hypothetical protein